MSTIHRHVLMVLEGLGVEHEVIEIDPAFADTATFCERYGYAPEQAANTLIVASKREPRAFCTCVVLATSRLDVNHKVKKLMGVSKASFATAEQMQRLTGMSVGGVTPLGLPPELPLYVDSRVMQPEWVILGGGGRHLKIKVSPRVLVRLGAEVVDELGLE